MRTWQRAETDTFCGWCRNRPIPRGDYLLRIQLPNLKRVLHRCVDCAGEAPPDLPALPVLYQRTSRMKPVDALAEKWVDTLREPGAEG